MKMILLPLLACLGAVQLYAADDYKLGPDSMMQPGVPQGVITKFTKWHSKILTNTVRDWWIYVPAQYKADQPACVMVFQDGHDYIGLKGGWRVPTVFDNLIAKKEMPVTIGIFINPGHQTGAPAAKPWQESNRSREYDSLGDLYSKLLLVEIFPEVSKNYNLTKDPAGRAAARSARSPWRGNGPMNSEKFSAPSAPSPIFAEGMLTRRSSAKPSANRSASFCRTARTTSTTNSATAWIRLSGACHGGWFS